MLMSGVWWSISLSKANKTLTHLNPVSLYLRQNVSVKSFDINSQPIRKFSTSGCSCSKEMVPARARLENRNSIVVKTKKAYASVQKFLEFKLSPKRVLDKRELLDAVYITYDDLLEEIDVDQFFIEFNMPDTFASWFTVVELHLWMISARLMREDSVGYHTRDFLTEAFFKDVSHRATLLGTRATLYRQKQVAILGYQFTAAYYGYDEGIQSSDKVLAAIVWRRFFAFECDDARLIERMVKYIRVQVDNLCYLSFNDIVFKRKRLVIPLSDIHIGD